MIEASRFVLFAASVPLAKLNVTIDFIRIKKLMLLSARERDACIFEDEAGRFDH